MLGALVGSNFGFIWAIAVLQRGIYRAWQNYGELEPALREPLQVGRAALAFGACLVAFGMVGFTSYSSANATTAADLGVYQVEYLSVWRVIDTADSSFCADNYFGCDLFLIDRQFGYTSAAFVAVPVPVSYPLDLYAEDRWTTYTLVNPSANLVTSEARPISGGTGYAYEFTTDSIDGDATLYAMLVFWRTGEHVVEVTVWSESAGIFEEKRAAINRLLDGLRHGGL